MLDWRETDAIWILGVGIIMRLAILTLLARL
jgi:hypothetical protein